MEVSWHAVGFLFTLMVGVYSWISNGQRAHRNDLDVAVSKLDLKIDAKCGKVDFDAKCLKVDRAVEKIDDALDEKCSELEEEKAQLEARVVELEKRVAQQAEALSHVPTKNDVFDVATLLIEVRAELRGLREQSTLTNLRVTRFEDYLVESGR